MNADLLRSAAAVEGLIPCCYCGCAFVKTYLPRNGGAPWLFWFFLSQLTTPCASLGSAPTPDGDVVVPTVAA